jgi:REP element-mobilizing transposase RayT
LPEADKNVRAPTEADKNVRAPSPKVTAILQRRVYETVAQKRHWAGPVEPAEAAAAEASGSKGWNTRGFLPHYDQPGTLQMVTFRLADALPASRRYEWETLFTLQDEREQRTKLEEYLDRGHGECVLRQPAVAAAVEEVFLCFDGRRYRLAAWVVMPNHAHLLFELWDVPLGQLLKAWKGTSARAANRVLGRSGTLWQEDYWDRFMRDEEHFRKAQHYIEWNPVKAHLVPQPEQWAFGSANPRWQWSAADRYRTGQLLNPSPPPSPRPPKMRPGTRPAGARTFLSAPRESRPAQADRNVRAPGEADRNVRAPGEADRNVRAPQSP